MCKLVSFSKVFLSESVSFYFGKIKQKKMKENEKLYILILHAIKAVTECIKEKKSHV